MESTQPTFTAAQIAIALAQRVQRVRESLRGVDPVALRIVAGQQTAAWAVAQLPNVLLEPLAIKSVEEKCKGEDMIQRVETLLTMPRKQWQPAIPLDKICDKDIQAATKLREAFKPWLIRQHDVGLSAHELEASGVEDYRRVCGNHVSTKWWRELLNRINQRDNGAEDWNRLEIYLLDRVKQKDAPAAVVSQALADEFSGLENYLQTILNPEAASKEQCAAVWKLALVKFSFMVRAGDSEKSAARRVRQFLNRRSPFLARSPGALWIAFKRKLAALQAAGGDLEVLEDARANNGDHVSLPQADVERLRHSAAVKNGGRIDAAWRQEYPLLNEITRQRYPASFKAPAKVHEILNREKVDALTARHQGKRKLRRMVGGVQREWNKVPSMHSWVVDDLTANIQVVLTDDAGAVVTDKDGEPYLFTPQVIAVMDSASRKFVGWAPSTAKAPNAGIVCDAVLDGIKTHGVPTRLGVENGFVFGKSLLVNGKEDEQGRTMVVGLGQFGCTVDHFEKMNPQSKSELEFGFEQIQRLMEQHPGYTGRLQMLDAPEEFIKQERLIRAGKADAKKFRYTFDEFIRVLTKIILQYNATPQQGRLKGLSPDASFSAGMDVGNPPIQFTSKLEWLLNERQIVTVKTGGVSFTHRSTGQPVKVRGDQLTPFVGQEIWAVMDRRDASLVTFMDQKLTTAFTMEICEKPSARESSFDAGSGVLAKERAKIREHERAISAEYSRLNAEFGNPRQDLLAQIRGKSNALASVPDQTTRRVIVNSRIESIGEKMELQRAEITAAKDLKKRRTTANKSNARRMGIPSVLVDDDEQTRRALELLRAGAEDVAEDNSTQEIQS